MSKAARLAMKRIQRQAIQRQEQAQERTREIHDISDRSRLIWERFFRPMQSAAATLNIAIAAAQDVVAGQIMEAEGFSADEFLFDVDSLTIVRRPKKDGTTNGG